MYDPLNARYASDTTARMREAAVTEDDVWAELHKGNVRRGGERIETPILSSGPRTDPWFQECGPRVIQAKELLVCDSDIIGCSGMCADTSHTWFVGDGRPTAGQRRLHAIDHEHLVTNMEVLRPGVSFRELSECGHRLSEEFGVIDCDFTALDCAMSGFPSSTWSIVPKRATTV